ncbi:uncharacterized protein LOC129948267 [Eupeodes corollae]|uniref:uncharacterized protein LOC129948267 n=1 Tax=Eupeodes corollae TaxID=290404 RepID=UPI00249017EF|nr:uncharacterized protein LOC129948267 [Eupeodes corollae]
MRDENKEVNIQEIIPLVEKKPVLWDHRLELFKHKNATLAAWNEICSDYNKDYVNFSEAERNNYREIIIRKWRNVKDSWRKNLVKAAKSKSNHRKYVYNKELMFLKQGMKIRPRNKPSKSPLKTETLTIIENDESSWHSEVQIKSESINTDDFEEIHFSKEEFKYDTSTTSKSDSRSRDKQDIYHEMPSFSSYSQSTSVSNQGESELSHLLNSRLEQQQQEQEDRHISFIKGVLPSLRNFNESQVLKFQMGILQLIQNIKENST